jgi:nitrate/TMAO reductase-like tetraheme cytochrome c subunit
VAYTQGQSPHGKDFKINCDACHTSENWTVSKDSISFDHDSTRFTLEGQHDVIDCRQCHSTLEFSKTESNCTACHLDIHQETVGQECSRCHNAESWLINDIVELHRQASFPLLGQHANAECTDCHHSETELKFTPIGVECVDCHFADYKTTQNPDHTKAGFSTSCSDCHKMDATDWSTEGINHDFFPLTKGHDINQCAECHKGSDYSKTSPECITCHETEYLTTTTFNHQTQDISTDCKECHTTDPGWKTSRV